MHHSNKIYISGNVPSSKNSKMWTGRMLISSKTVRKYIAATEYDWMANKSKFLTMIDGLEKPYKIHFKFIRDSKRRFDYINALQCPLDLMVKNGYLEDDNADNVIPVIEPYEYKKGEGGLILSVKKEGIV